MRVEANKLLCPAGMADSRPRAARIAHAGLPPAAFPTQPSLDRLAILSVQDGSIRLKLRPLSLGKQPKTARLSINRDSFKESSPALLAVAQRHCFSLEACSPTGHALITAVHDAPACLQMWQLPGCRCVQSCAAKCERAAEH